MGKLEDMVLLIEVVDAGGLAAAGRRMNLSPAAMTARLHALEERYQTRLFNRSTRSIALTPMGEELYQFALQILGEVKQAEERLTQKEGTLSGTLSIAAPSDFGHQYLSPALLAFTERYPAVKCSVFLSENVVDLITHRLDMGIRFGNLPDSNLVMRRIKPNHRVLVASPTYLKKYGKPQRPEDLLRHRCLALECCGTLFNEWRFESETLRVTPAMICDDGALLRHWALSGAGVASKSWWDVKSDVATGGLQVLFADSFLGFSRHDKKEVGLQFVYPQNRFQPAQVSLFSSFFIDWLEHT